MAVLCLVSVAFETRSYEVCVYLAALTLCPILTHARLLPVAPW